MNVTEIKRPYKAPLVEVFLCPKSLNVLVALSVEASIEDWEEGDEL